MESAAAILREARASAGLTQRTLAQRASTTQSVISAYESGAREPSLATLRRLVEATGHELQVRTVRPGASTHPLRRRVMDRRHELIAAAGRYDITDLRLFGSVARGDERPDSDVDLLATLPPSLTLWSLAAAEEDLGEIVQAKIDLVPLADLKPGVREQVLAEAVPL